MQARIRVWQADGQWIRERLVPCDVLVIGTDGARVRYRDRWGELIEAEVSRDELEPAEVSE